MERKNIIILLNNLGVPAHVKGYNYLAEAIELCGANPTISLTKELCVDIAKKYDDTPSRVERAMRHAIEIAWQRNDIVLSTKIFGNAINGKSGKPTNSQFCKTVANHLKYNL